MTAKDQSATSGSEQQLIRELAELLNETGLSEIEIEKSGLKIRVARTLAVQHAVAAAPAAASSGPAKAASADPAKHPGAVKSPMVGTAYRSPEPGTPPFIEVGSRVAQGERASKAATTLEVGQRLINHLPWHGRAARGKRGPDLVVAETAMPRRSVWPANDWADSRAAAQGRPPTSRQLFYSSSASSGRVE